MYTVYFIISTKEHKNSGVNGKILQAAPAGCSSFPLQQIPTHSNRNAYQNQIPSGTLFHWPLRSPSFTPLHKNADCVLLMKFCKGSV
jgi:hypothetical protein